MKKKPTPADINPATGLPYKKTKEVRERMSEAQKNSEKAKAALSKNRIKTPEINKKISDSMMGHKVSVTTKVKMMEKKLGKKRPAAVIEKIIATRKMNQLIKQQENEKYQKDQDPKDQGSES